MHLGGGDGLAHLVEGQDVDLVRLVDRLVVDGQFIGVAVNDLLLMVLLLRGEVVPPPFDEVMKSGSVVLLFGHQLTRDKEQ